MRSLVWAGTGYSAHGLHEARIKVARAETGAAYDTVSTAPKKTLGTWMNVRATPELWPTRIQWDRILVRAGGNSVR